MYNECEIIHGSFVVGIESAKNGKLLYHLTDLNNLSSIFENGLCSRKDLLHTSMLLK